MEDTKLNLQFVPFSSVVSSSFWESFSKLKLHELKLNTDPIEITGVYTRRGVEGVSPLLHLQHDSLGKASVQQGEVQMPGILINTNTVEEFKNSNKAELLGSVGDKIWKAIVSGEAETDPTVLLSFLLYVNADLKKYHYYYWFAFPAFLYPRAIELSSPSQFLSTKIEDQALIEEIKTALWNSSVDLTYFTLVIKSKAVTVLPLSAYHESLKTVHENGSVWLGFSDPSSLPHHPGWTLRNLLTLAAVRWNDVKTHTVFAFREKVSAKSSSIGESLIFEIAFGDESIPELPRTLGWEKNERGKMGPKFSNMAKSMDPSRIAESSVELNLRLMKWRLDPSLNLEIVKNCKCLLIGAGTLGCNVARCLLGWGVQTITLVDCGRVSFSNPVRQSLFVFDDCLQEGKMKAEAAASALKRIFPRVNAKGVVLSIPMPGHPVSDSNRSQIIDDISTLERLIDEHDVLFLLTDSRESRWLPSLIGASKQKIVLTAALGFDSYLVMRHGIRYEHADETVKDNIGCYFCNDVVAPGDSTSDRALDQQCTVTRPGVSFMAAGHMVEILIETLQHPFKSRTEEENVPPHSIRYYLGRMNQLVTTSPPFKNCSACSSVVISTYREDGGKFLIKVFNSPRYLEDVSGLTKLHQESQTMEILELSDGEETE